MVQLRINYFLYISLLLVLYLTGASNTLAGEREDAIGEGLNKQMDASGPPDREKNPPQEAQDSVSQYSSPPIDFESLKEDLGADKLVGVLEKIGDFFADYTCTALMIKGSKLLRRQFNSKKWGRRVEKILHGTNQAARDQSALGCISHPLSGLDFINFFKSFLPEIVLMPYEEGLQRTNLASDFVRSDGKPGCEPIPYYKSGGDENVDPVLEFGMCKDIYMYGTLIADVFTGLVDTILSLDVDGIKNKFDFRDSAEPQPVQHDLYRMKEGDIRFFYDFKLIEFMYGMLIQEDDGGKSKNKAKKATKSGKKAAKAGKKLKMSAKAGIIKRIIDNTVLIMMTVQKMGDVMCVIANTAIGPLPVGCRQIAEPYPENKFASNLNCADFGRCLEKAQAKSQQPMSMTAPFVHCITLYLNGMMQSPSLDRSPVCCLDQYFTTIASNESNKVSGIVLKKPGSDSSCTDYSGGISILQYVRNYMSSIVSYLLMIYIIFFGYKLTVAPSEHSSKDFILLALKVVFVSYFAIGTQDDEGNYFNGFTEYIFPLVLELSNLTYNIMFSSIDNKLCTFNPADYDTGFEHFQLWDSLDCRLSHYLVVGTSSEPDKGLMSSIFAFSPAVMIALGNIVTFVSLILFAFLMLLIIANLVQVIVISLFFLSVMSLLAPIYIPTILFSYSRQYFDQWLKQLISFALQPMVIIAFFALMINIFDYTIYKTCDFMEVAYEDPFGNGLKKDYFTVEPEDEDKKEQCRKSLGWSFAPDFILFADNIYEIKMENKDKIAEEFENSAFIGVSRKIDELLHFTFFETVFGDLEMPDINFNYLTYEAFRVVMFAIIFFYFSMQITTLASDITTGASISGATTTVASMMQSSKKMYDKKKEKDKENKQQGGG